MRTGTKPRPKELVVKSGVVAGKGNARAIAIAAFDDWENTTLEA